MSLVYMSLPYTSWGIHIFFIWILLTAVCTNLIKELYVDDLTSENKISVKKSENKIKSL